jgi:hypothetical protein
LILPPLQPAVYSARDKAETRNKDVFEFYYFDQLNGAIELMMQIWGYEKVIAGI